MEVVGTPISANLIGVFFMGQRLQRDPGVSDPTIKPKDVKRVGVLGAGQMGAGIAAANARSGIPTVMVDVDDARIAAGLEKARDVVMSRIKIGRATPQDMVGLLSSLNTSTNQTAFTECDVVIEAVVEDEKVKTAVFRELAKVLKPDAILASNTSTISITPHGQVRARPVAVHRDALLLPGRPHGAGRGDPGRADERPDRGDRRGAGEEGAEDPDRRQGLRRVPGEPGAVPLHERRLALAERGGVDGRDRQGRDQVLDADGPDRAGTTSSALTLRTTPGS